MRKFHDEEEDARQDEEEASPKEEDEGNSQDKHVQSKAVQSPEAHESRVHKGLQGDISKIILFQNHETQKIYIQNVEITSIKAYL